jgi:riboflavin kinase/FMN adenylyltransferase
MAPPIKIFPGHESVRGIGVPRVVAIGNFDGVHLGHQRLFALARGLADESGAEATVLTFVPHPAKVLAPAVAPKLITTPERKRELCAACGIAAIVEEPFDLAFAARSPESFVDEVLIEGLAAIHACVGYDFTFGKGRSGNAETLRALMARRGRQVTVLPPFSIPDPEDPTARIICSSTRVREEVEAGRPHRAALLLGRDPEIEGIVVPGAGRGAAIGVPTANLRPLTELCPATGVYAAWAELSDEKAHGEVARYPAAVNVGYNPTFTSPDGQAPLTIEAHLLLPTASPPLPPLYGRRLRLHLRRRLRAEQRFPSVSALVTQIGADIAATRQLLAKEV